MYRRLDVKLKLSDENGRIEIELEVDQNRNGITWRVVVCRNGAVVVTTTGTRPPERVVRGSPSDPERGRADRISAVATSPAAGAAPSPRRLSRVSWPG